VTETATETSTPTATETPTPGAVAAVCAGLPEDAARVCHAYCEAQNCDEDPQPSCEELRNMFERLTGSSVLPCDLGALTIRRAFSGRRIRLQRPAASSLTTQLRKEMARPR
jgi:hypothetical protein